MNETLGGPLQPGVVMFNPMEAPAGRIKELWGDPPAGTPESRFTSPGALHK